MLLGALGLLWAAVAVLDPTHPSGCVGGPLLAGAGLLAERASPRRRTMLFVAVLCALLGVTALTVERFRVDSFDYYVPLRSLAFDLDLEYGNEAEIMGQPRGRTPTGYTANTFPVGPAILWSPAFAFAHVYVVAARMFGMSDHPADGYSAPYLRSPALATVPLAFAAVWLLCGLVGHWTSRETAWTGIVGTALVSPILYYVFVLPSMAHGLSFAAAAAVVWAAGRADEAPSRRAWIRIGVLFGALVMTRWQAAVFALALMPQVLLGLRRRTIAWTWLLAAAGAAFAVFVPQMIAWKILYGSVIAVPSAADFAANSKSHYYFDWSSPRLGEVLFAADCGLFYWHPGLVFGVVGLLFAVRRRPVTAGGALAALAAITWMNGSVSTWHGDDTFGARRFDVVLPLLGIGAAFLVEAAMRLVSRRPVLVPIAAVLVLALWNAGLVRLKRIGEFSSSAPLVPLAAAQARQVQSFTRGLLVRMAGERGRSWAYRLFVGEYLYYNLNESGRFDMARIEPRYLVAPGWSEPRFPPEGPAFRWARAPRACLTLPLDRPLLLRTRVTARAPEGVGRRAVHVEANGHSVASRTLGPEWEDVSFDVPEELLRSGENHLCFVFGPEAGPESTRAAAIAHVQLP